MFGNLFESKGRKYQLEIFDAAISLTTLSLPFLKNPVLNIMEQHLVYFYSQGVVDFLCQQKKVSHEEYMTTYAIQLAIRVNQEIGSNITVKSLSEHQARIKIEKLMIVAVEDFENIMAGDTTKIPRLYKFIEKYREKNLDKETSE